MRARSSGRKPRGIMSFVAEPAYTEADDQGDFHLLVDGEGKTFRVEHDERGRAFLVEVLPLPAELESLFAEQDSHPERMVRRSARG